MGTHDRHDRQLDLAHERAHARGPSRPPARERAREHASNLCRVDERAAGSEDPAKDAALTQLKVLLIDFLRRMGVGATVQAADFTRWLDETGQRPQLVDMHTLGGLIQRLKYRGLLTFLRYEQTGDYGNANSSARSVYRITSLDTSNVGWSLPETAVKP